MVIAFSHYMNIIQLFIIKVHNKQTNDEKFTINNKHTNDKQQTIKNRQQTDTKQITNNQNKQNKGQ